MIITRFGNTDEQRRQITVRPVAFDRSRLADFGEQRHSVLSDRIMAGPVLNSHAKTTIAIRPDVVVVRFQHDMIAFHYEATAIVGVILHDTGAGSHRILEVGQFFSFDPNRVYRLRALDFLGPDTRGAYVLRFNIDSLPPIMPPDPVPVRSVRIEVFSLCPPQFILQPASEVGGVSTIISARI